MRRILTCLLLTGLVGCGGTSTTPESADATAPQVAPGTPAPGSEIVPASGTEVAAPSNRKTLTPEQALSLAQQLVQRKDYDNALKVVNEVIKASPRLADAYVTRAAIFAENKLLTRAVDDMSAAITLSGDNPKFHNTRGYFQLLQQNYIGAKEDFTNAIGLDLDYAQPYNNRGLVRIALGDFKDAVADFDNAIKLDAKYVDAHNNRGFALMQLGQHADSIAAFSQALEADPKYVNALNNRGQAHHKAGDFLKATEDFTQAIQIAPGNLVYYSQRADAYRALSDEESARKDIEHVEWTARFVALSRELARGPKDPQAWNNRGRHLMSRGKLDEALSDFDRAKQLDPANELAQVGRAEVWHRQGKSEEAALECSSMIQKTGCQAAYSLRGDISFSAGDYTAAINDYTSAQRLDTQVAEAYIRRAAELREQGQVQQASADLEQAAAIDPELRTADGTELPKKPAPPAPPAAAPFPE